MEMLDNDVFDLKKWKDLVQQNANDLFGNESQTIVPFGFEVTNDKSYLSKNLNRFYCYFYNPNISYSKENEILFADKLLLTIKSIDLDFFNRISIVVFERDDKETCILNNLSPESILINIEQREKCRDLLDDYAEYLLCCLYAIEDNCLSEFIRYDDNLNIRNRCYQLYLIIEYSTQYMSIPFSPDEKMIFHSLHKLNKSPINHYYTSKKYQESTDHDKLIYRIIKERLHKIFVAVNSEPNPEIISVKCKKYNSAGLMEYKIPLKLYERFTDYVKETYINFTEL